MTIFNCNSERFLFDLKINLFNSTLFIGSYRYQSALINFSFMKSALLVVLFAIVPYCLFAQKPPMKFGKISQEEIDLQYFEQDSAAVAVVLADYGRAYINVNIGKLVFERHTRVKILKKEGLDYASGSILLYHSGSSEETVSNLKGVTYNLEDGKLEETKLSKSSIFTEKYNRNYNLQKFAFENVKVGSIIEYSYTVYSEFFFNFPSWEFQSTIPTIWSEYRAEIPDFFFYEKYMQGYLPLAIAEVEKRNQGQSVYSAHRWVVENAPAFKEEAYMTCEDDYISKMNFALSHYKLNGIVYEIMGSWQKLRENLLKSEYFGTVVDRSAFLNRTVKELTASITDPEEKVRVIYDYIKEKIEWNGISEYSTNTLKEAFKEGKGTSADLNLGLASMLKEADIEVDLVLLSTRDHGFIRPQYSMASQFNYVICKVYVNGKVLFLDATDKDLPQDILPERCLNGKGLLISKSRDVEWVPLEFSDKSKSLISSDFLMSESGDLTGKLDFTRSRYFARNTRERYRSKGKEEYVKSFVSGKPWKVVDSNFSFLDDIAQPVKEEMKVEISDHVMLAGDMAYLNPILLSRIEENPFKREEREYPVDFGSPFERMYISKVTIPENFVVEELPQSRIIALPQNGGKYIYNITNTGKTIFITSNFSINKSLFVQDEYPVLREFYNQVVAMQSEQIVLKKVK